MTTDRGEAWVCIDCYFAHHYGAERVERDITESERDKFDYTEQWGDATYRRDLMGLERVNDDTVAEWFAGESDQRCEGGEPLADLPDFGHESGGYRVTMISDWTCSNHFYGQTVTPDDWDGEGPEPVCDQCGGTDWEDGEIEFTWRSCDGCNSHLGGSRHRLAIHWEKIAEEVT